MNLNEKPIPRCYAFELRLIVENRREDGFRGSIRRRLRAEEELERRARAGDPKSAVELGKLADARMGAA